MSSDEPSSKRPKYKRIADDLRAAIERGEYVPGDRLPGEHALSAEYGVAVMTVRQALSVLKSEGLAESRKGAGVFVQSFKPIRRRGIQRLSRERWGSGKTIWSADEDRPLTIDQARVEEVAPPAHVAEVLGLEAGATACLRARRFVLDGRPVMLASSYLPYTLVEGSAITRADTGPGGTYARLADLGRAPVHFREEIRSRMSNSAEADQLELPGHRPVLLLVRTAFDVEGVAVEVNEMTMDSTAYVLDYEFDA
ncbi:GntR family transcriptional regulator [Streptomyces sp. NPDC090231]|uniref:GntR family transcriptional regulator n=1 Tax=unclassified Streptomyces TaxID=2593676 RepID=UPI002E0F576C|nr:GntR family transcriptional regulator [Streptomyces sp. NBC_01324]